MTTACFWCGRKFRQRRGGGSHQKYCSQKCRHAYGTAARRWVTAALRQGHLTIQDLMHAPSACAAAGEDA